MEQNPVPIHDVPEVKGTCPECGQEITNESPIAHANHHWNPATPNQLWSELAWERRRQVYAMEGVRLPRFQERA